MKEIPRKLGRHGKPKEWELLGGNACQRPRPPPAKADVGSWGVGWTTDVVTNHHVQLTPSDHHLIVRHIRFCTLKASMTLKNASHGNLSRKLCEIESLLTELKNGINDPAVMFHFHQYIDQAQALLLFRLLTKPYTPCCSPKTTFFL